VLNLSLVRAKDAAVVGRISQQIRGPQENALLEQVPEAVRQLFATSSATAIPRLTAPPKTAAPATTRAATSESGPGWRGPVVGVGVAAGLGGALLVVGAAGLAAAAVLVVLGPMLVYAPHTPGLEYGARVMLFPTAGAVMGVLGGVVRCWGWS